MRGHCLCGAVRVTATATAGHLTACNCENCRRWSSGPYYAFAADPATAEIAGPVKTITIMPWAERGFCGECGSALFYRVTADGPYKGNLKLAAGLFEEGTGLPLGEEYYIDRAPAGFDLNQDHVRLTKAEIEARFASPESGA